MSSSKINSIGDLKYFLANALQLEHSTIPPYLTALYSIMPGTNSDAMHVIRVVVVEEMLHLTLVANMLNAIGGKPDLTGEDFIPHYPTKLNDGEQDFEVNLERFSVNAIENFLKIEQPTKKPDIEVKFASIIKSDTSKMSLLKADKSLPRLDFQTIGEFYEAVKSGFDFLYEKEGPALFCGDSKRQVQAEYYYSGGGELFPTTDIESVRKALNLIAEQGEGYGGMIFSKENELAHYFRFQQLKNKKYYMSGDKPGVPTGPPLDVDFSAVYPIKTNATLDDYPKDSELYTAALEFAQFYHEFLQLVTEAFNGQPEKLGNAAAWMFKLKEKATAIIRNPIPGQEGMNGLPIFKRPKTGGAP